MAGGLHFFTMSLFDEISSGFDEAETMMAEGFTLSNHSGKFTGIFRGEDAPVDHGEIQGYQTETTQALSAKKSQFLEPPMVNETLTKDTGERYAITMIESSDETTWDMELTRLDV